jgi:predicted PurR-regulated permease PerM
VPVDNAAAAPDGGHPGRLRSAPAEVNVPTPSDDRGHPTGSRVSDDVAAERRFYRRLGAVLLLGALAYLVWSVLAPVWHPVAWALLLGTLLAPFNARFASRLGGRTALASAVTLVLVVLLFLLPVAVVGRELAAQAINLQQRFELGVPGTGEAGSELPGLRALERALAPLATRLQVSPARVHDWLASGGHQLTARLAASGGVLLKGAIGTGASFVLMLFVLFFVLRDGPDLARAVVRLLPIEPQRRTRLWLHLVEVTRAVFLGIGVAALVHGLLMGVGAWLVGLPSPLVLGLLAALLALIPVVGSALVWVPAVLFLVAQGQTGHAIFFAAWSVALVGVVDHLLRPVLISGHAQVPALPVFLGVMGGLHAFGFIGLFIGPIVLGMLVALFRYESELHPA